MNAPKEPEEIVPTPKACKWCKQTIENTRGSRAFHKGALCVVEIDPEDDGIPDPEAETDL